MKHRDHVKDYSILPQAQMFLTATMLVVKSLATL